MNKELEQNVLDKYPLTEVYLTRLYKSGAMKNSPRSWRHKDIHPSDVLSRWSNNSYGTSQDMRERFKYWEMGKLGEIPRVSYIAVDGEELRVISHDSARAWVVGVYSHSRYSRGSGFVDEIAKSFDYILAPIFRNNNHYMGIDPQAILAEITQIREEHSNDLNLETTKKENKMLNKAKQLRNTMTDQNKEAAKVAAKIKVGKLGNDFLVKQLSKLFPWYAKKAAKNSLSSPLMRLATAEAVLAASNLASDATEQEELRYIGEAMIQEAAVDALVYSDVLEELAKGLISATKESKGLGGLVDKIKN